MSQARAAPGALPPEGRLVMVSSMDGGRGRITLRGELDAGTAARLQSAVAQLAVENRELILDLRRLTFIDFDGVRALLICRHGSRSLKLTGAQGQVLAVLNRLGLLERLTVAEP